MNDCDAISYRPRVHEFIQEMHREVLAGTYRAFWMLNVSIMYCLAHDLITVGETPNTYDAATIAAYVLPGRKELNMVFQFDLMDLDSPKVGTDYVPLRAKAVTVADIRGTIVPWQTFMREEGFWNTCVRSSATYTLFTNLLGRVGYSPRTTTTRARSRVSGVMRLSGAPYRQKCLPSSKLLKAGRSLCTRARSLGSRTSRARGESRNTKTSRRSITGTSA